MQNDKTTLKDLSFMPGGSGGLFELIDHTLTQMGRDALRKMVLSPPENFDELARVQEVVKFMTDRVAFLPPVISNGTLVMLESFFEAADHTTPPPKGFAMLFSSFFQKIFNNHDYTLNQFSVSHISDFLKGVNELVGQLEHKHIPAKLQAALEELQKEMASHPLTKDLLAVTKHTPYKDLARLSYLARRSLKNPVYRMMKHYAKLDAWYALAKATKANGWAFPVLQPAYPVCLKASGLYHPLLQAPVTYDADFDGKHNFMMLTGANMSGKTTFMRALGVAALLAHLGMGVPAKAMEVSFLQGIITNMHVEDNIMLGESYFFAEVQRIKQTAEKLLQPQPHLVLMDELFKGTNVHDAYECTRAVVDALLQHKHHLMILSTHLYEVAQQFNETSDIIFSYFITDLTTEGHYSFTYQLKPGISNDRIGYRILQKEGVIDLLKAKSK